MPDTSASTKQQLKSEIYDKVPPVKLVKDTRKKSAEELKADAEARAWAAARKRYGDGDAVVEKNVDTQVKAAEARAAEAAIPSTVNEADMPKPVADLAPVTSTAPKPYQFNKYELGDIGSIFEAKLLPTGLKAKFEGDNRPGVYDEDVEKALEAFLGKAPNDRNFANTNLALGGEFPNISGVSPAETLRRQRLIDVLNNKVYLKPTAIGYGIGGGNERTTASGMPEFFQMPKIETEDTRQMARMRDWENKVRNAEIERQQGYKDDELEVRKLFRNELVRKSGQLSDNEILRENAKFNELIHLNNMKVSQEYALSYETFIKKFAANLDRDKAQIALNAWYDDPLLGNMIGQLYLDGATLPSLEQKLLNDSIKQVMVEGYREGASPDQLVLNLVEKMATYGFGQVQVWLDLIAKYAPDLLKQAGGILFGGRTDVAN